MARKIKNLPSIPPGFIIGRPPSANKGRARPQLLRIQEVLSNPANGALSAIGAAAGGGGGATTLSVVEVVTVTTNLILT